MPERGMELLLCLGGSMSVCVRQCICAMGVSPSGLPKQGEL